MKISIVIPCWNDRGKVVQRVEDLKEARGVAEIVIADATPEPTGWKISGAVVLPCATASRGAQMNAGAKECSGDILVFNHADSILTPDHLESLRRLEPNVIGGGFYKAFRSHHPRMGRLEPLVRWYTKRWGILYGDHTIFVRREHFESIGGFAPVRLMEDVEFSDRLRASGKIALLDPPLQTSMRRFRRRGYLRTRLQNLLFVWLWRLKLADDESLHRWYYGEG